ncbi:hypothetical protein QZH41_015833, partial [Actinostola sp. cb2023]
MSSTVEDWLRSLGLIQYTQAFLDNGYDELDICKEIGEEDLDAIGVKNIKDRVDILSAVARLKQSGTAVYFVLEEGAQPPPNTQTRESIIPLKLKMFLRETLEEDNIRLSELPYTLLNGLRGNLDNLVTLYADKFYTYEEDVFEALDSIRVRQVGEMQAQQMQAQQLNNQMVQENPSPTNETQRPISSKHKRANRTPSLNSVAKEPSGWNTAPSSMSTKDTPVLDPADYLDVDTQSSPNKKQKRRRPVERNSKLSRSLDSLKELHVNTDVKSKADKDTSTSKPKQSSLFGIFRSSKRKNDDKSHDTKSVNNVVKAGAEFPASNITMGEEDRVALMLMVKSGELTVEEAVQQLESYEKEHKKVPTSKETRTSSSCSEEESPKSHHKLKRGIFGRSTKKKTMSRPGSEIAACDMTMSEEDRINLMKGVRDHEITVEDAMQKLLRWEILLTTKPCLLQSKSIKPKFSPKSPHSFSRLSIKRVSGAFSSAPKGIPKDESSAVFYAPQEVVANTSSEDDSTNVPSDSSPDPSPAEHRKTAHDLVRSAKYNQVMHLENPYYNMVEISCYNMVENPCYNMVEIPCYNMVEIPCYNMVEIPCYNMVEIPCYNMVEIPCYNMVEIPYYSMVEIPCYNMVEIPCYNMVEIPCYNIVENPCYNMVESSCYNIVENPCYNIVENPCYNMVENHFTIWWRTHIHSTSSLHSSSSSSDAVDRLGTIEDSETQGSPGKRGLALHPEKRYIDEIKNVFSKRGSAEEENLAPGHISTLPRNGRPKNPSLSRKGSLPLPPSHKAPPPPNSARKAPLPPPRPFPRQATAPVLQTSGIGNDSESTPAKVPEKAPKPPLLPPKRSSAGETSRNDLEEKLPSPPSTLLMEQDKCEQIIDNSEQLKDLPSRTKNNSVNSNRDSLDDDVFPLPPPEVVLKEEPRDIYHEEVECKNIVIKPPRPSLKLREKVFPKDDTQDGGGFITAPSAHDKEPPLKPKSVAAPPPVTKPKPVVKKKPKLPPKPPAKPWTLLKEDLDEKGTGVTADQASSLNVPDFPVPRKRPSHSLSDLIQRRLRIEQIDLTDTPYSSQDGCWVIPINLVDRYTEEMRRSQKEVVEIMDKIRCTKLKEKGRSLIPCDVSLYPQEPDHLGQVGTLEEWLISLGLPMYIDNLKEVEYDDMNAMPYLKQKHFEYAAMAVAVVPDILEKELHIHATVELSGHHTREIHDVGIPVRIPRVPQYRDK